MGAPAAAELRRDRVRQARRRGDDLKLARTDEAVDKLAADGKRLGILIPYFRSMNTDINSPLSIAIMAMIPNRETRCMAGPPAAQPL